MNHGAKSVYPKVAIIARNESGLAALNRQSNWLYVAYPELVQTAVCADPNISFAILDNGTDGFIG
jgi:hypothetical protein